MLVMSEVLMMAGLLDAQIESKTSDIIAGNHIKSVTIKNRFNDDTGFIIEGDSITEVRNTKNKKLLQNDTLYATYETDAHGNVTSMETYRYIDENRESKDLRCVSMSEDIKWSYDNEGRVVNRIELATQSINEKIAMLELRRTHTYGDKGIYSMSFDALIIDEDMKFTMDELKIISEITTSKLYVFGYDDFDRVNCITLISVDNLNRKYETVRANIVYAKYEVNLISYIHIEGETQLEDEFFTYYNDGTISAIKNGCVNGKISERSEIIYHKKAKEVTQVAAIA